jgi:heptosyltransferase-2
MKNFLLRQAARWLQRESRTRDRYLVVSTTALGDTLWATPAIESLRLSFPDAYIAVLTSSIGEQALRYNPWTDRIHLLKSPFHLYRELGEYSDCIILHASQRFILPFCATLGARRIVGTSGINKGLDNLLTHPLDNSLNHQIIRRLELIEQVGAKRHTDQLSFFLQPEERIPKPDPFIVLHPGSKDPFRRWPAHHFVTIGRALQAQGYQIFVNGTETDLTHSIASQIPGAQTRNLSLRAFAALLSHASLLIANDTGPIHLASALKVPLIGLYTPSDPKLFGPLNVPHSLALAKPPTCTPCLKRKCRESFCFEQLRPQEVLTAAQTLLST